MRELLIRSIVVLSLIAGIHAWAAAKSTHGKGDNSEPPDTATGGTGPRIVLIIRHAEKPDEAKEDKNPNLSPRGFQRAAALAIAIPRDFPHPDFLIATKKSSHSNRPMETIEPLAKALHEPIEATILDDDFPILAHKLLNDPKYNDKVVLIAWHHGKIPELAHALGASEAPAKWSGKVFDRVWEINFAGGKATWKDLPEKALPGDSEK